MDCQHLDDLYELYVLGVGVPEGDPGGEMAEIAEHLERGCSYCRERLREAIQVAYFITRNLRPLRSVRPRPELRAAILRRAGKRKLGQ